MMQSRVAEGVSKYSSSSSDPTFSWGACLKS